ncbi:MAG: AAA family ATPase, partial [Burkholderiales bacterium]
MDYLQALIARTRQSPHYVNGLSPRAGLALLHSARAWALMHGRNQVLPEDVQAVLPSVVGHRLQPAGDHVHNKDLAESLINAVPIP